MVILLNIFFTAIPLFFFSTHDQFAYPGTGSPQKTGKGKGKGFNLNIHLRCGSGDEEIVRVFKKKYYPLRKVQTRFYNYICWI